MISGRSNVARCRNVIEHTTYLEMVSYSVRDASVIMKKLLLTSLQDPTLNSIEEHPLTPDEFENFLNRRVRWIFLHNHEISLTPLFFKGCFCASRITRRSGSDSMRSVDVSIHQRNFCYAMLTFLQPSVKCQAPRYFRYQCPQFSICLVYFHGQDYEFTF